MLLSRYASASLPTPRSSRSRNRHTLTAVAEPLERRALLAATTLNVDTAQSSLTVSGSAFGLPFLPQDLAGTSVVTSYAGTVVVDLTPGMIAFPGGSNVRANNSGDWRPSEPEGEPPVPNGSTTDPANYGVQFGGIGTPFAGVGALREGAFDATGDARPYAAADGAFDSSGIMAMTIAGFIDYVVEGLGSDRTEAAGGTANNTATAGDVTIDEGMVTVVVPVDITYELSSGVQPGVNDVFFTFRGQLVASGPLPPATVADRRVFYNNSAFDTPTKANPGLSNDTAIPDKVALLPGQAATYANVISFTKGLNGVIVDLADAFESSEIAADDFTFRVGDGGDPAQYTNAPAPTLLVRPGAGRLGSDRVEFTWADGAILKQWLQVTVLPNADTGLAVPDVFYFGNLPGEIGDNDALFVNAVDVQRTRLNQFQTADINSPYDHNRNGGIVNAQDVQFARINQFSTIAPFTAPPVVAALGAAGDDDDDDEERN